MAGSGALRPWAFRTTRWSLEVAVEWTGSAYDASMGSKQAKPGVMATRSTMGPAPAALHGAEAVVSERPGLRMVRRRLPAPAGLIGLEATISAAAPVERVIVSGEWWICTHISVAFGWIAAVGPHHCQTLPSSFLLLVPPFSIVRLVMVGEFHCPGLSGKTPLPKPIGPTPAYAPIDAVSAGPPDLGPWLAHLSNAGRPLEFANPTAPYVEVARQALVAERDRRNPVALAARAAGIDPGTLSRAFGKAYGLSPKAYVHRIRVADAVFSLLAGVPILQTALDVGFGEMSRFYDQFAHITQNTPGQYVRLRAESENGKPAGPGLP